MTITAGFRVEEGILLCADTQYTGSSKIYQKKIFCFEASAPGRSSFAFALAGHEINARMAIDDCIDAIRRCAEDDRSEGRIAYLLRGAVKAVYDEYVERKTDPSEKETARFELVIGAWLPAAGGLHLFKSSGGGVIYGDDYYSAGIGTYLGDYIMRPVFLNKLSLDDVLILALRGLHAAKAYDAYCGGESQFLRITPGGGFGQAERLAVENAEGFITRYEHLEGALLLGTASRTIKDEVFEKYLGVFTTAIRHIRKSWISGEHPQQNLTTLEKMISAVYHEAGLLPGQEDTRLPDVPNVVNYPDGHGGGNT